jgi:hypothetical protein
LEIYFQDILFIHVTIVTKLLLSGHPSTFRQFQFKIFIIIITTYFVSFFIKGLWSSKIFLPQQVFLKQHCRCTWQILFVTMVSCWTPWIQSIRRWSCIMFAFWLNKNISKYHKCVTYLLFLTYLFKLHCETSSCNLY